MSNLSDFQLLSPSTFDTVEIGEVISVLTKSPPPSTYFNGDYILVGNVYSQSSYPLLYAKLGLITASGVSYNTSTQFYVPVISKSYPSVSLPQSTLSQPQLTIYMRAR